MSTATEIINNIKFRAVDKCVQSGCRDAEFHMIHELEISLHHALVRLGQMATGPSIISAEARITLDEIEKGVN